MKRYNICTSRTYTKNGEEKKQWNTVGTLVEFEATQDKPKSFIIDLGMFPHTQFSAFEQKEKDDQVVNKKALDEMPTVQVDDLEDDIK